MSELVQSQQGGSLQQASSSTSSSALQSASFSSSSSTSSSMTSSSSTKVVKQSTTTVKQSSSSSSSFSSSSTTSSSSSRVVSVKSSGTSYSDRLALDMGISDINKEMERLQLRLGDEMNNIHRDIFRLMPSTSQVVQEAIESSSSSSSSSSNAVGGSGANQFLVKLDNDAIKSCIDKAHDDRVKLNFDVNEFQAETINIRTVGNKIEVHAMKKSKKGDEERSEEFSRVYELPTENQLDANHVTSSIYKDGVLTIELPLSDALGSALTL